MFLDKDTKAIAAGAGAAALLVVLLSSIVNFFLGGYLLQYTIEQLGPIVAHHPVTVSFWVCGLVCFLLGKFGRIVWPVALITWLISSIS